MRPFDVTKDHKCNNCGTYVHWVNWHYPVCYECTDRSKDHKTMRCYICGMEMLIADRLEKRIDCFTRSVCRGCYGI